MCKAAHEFRGEFIDSCARVEHWLSDVLARADAATPRSRQAYLFGQKLRTVVSLVSAEPALFSNAERVGKLLDEFQDFATLRSRLAHAVVTVTGADPHFLFYGAGRLPVGDTWRFWVTHNEATEINTRLKTLAEHICDQKLNA